MKKYIKVIVAMVLWVLGILSVSAADRIVYDVEQISDNKVMIELKNLDSNSQQGIKVEGIERTEEDVIKITYKMVAKAQENKKMPYYFQEGQYPAPIYLHNSADSEMKKFSDLNPADSFHQPIMNLYFKGVISGYDDGTVKKDNAITREQFAKMMVVMGGYELDTTTKSVFSDVSDSKWSKPYIMTLYNKGIISGDGTGQYRPGDNVSAGAIATMVDRMFLFYEKTNKSSIGTGHWAYKHMQVLYNAGIIKSGDSYFNNPDKVATRGEACKILHRTILAFKETKLAE